jgi:hypothetical protein
MQNYMATAGERAGKVELKGVSGVVMHQDAHRFPRPLIFRARWAAGQFTGFDERSQAAFRKSCCSIQA